MTPRTKGALTGIAVPIVALVLIAVFWNWDWFIPIVDSRVSAQLGRKVTMKHLHVALGRIVTVRADGVKIDNPKGFQAAAPLARIRRLTVKFDIVDYLFHHRTVVPSIDLDTPVIEAMATPTKSNNYTFKATKPTKPKKPTPAPQIGVLTIENGHVHFVDPALKADMHIDVATRPATGVVAKQGQSQEIVATARGTYNRQPITGTLTAGALLTLQKTAQPYPVDLALANGTTHVSLVGTVNDPLHFAGANLLLTLTGTNMKHLYALTGIPIPDTPRYSVSGNLDYRKNSIRFTNFHGVVGNSDLEGTIRENPGALLSNGGAKPLVHMDLFSHRVDLKDLGGFIGTKAGGKHEAGTTPAQRVAIARSEAKNPNLLPNKPFNLPKLNAADIYLHYKAASIEGRSMPLDNLLVNLDIVNGAIRLHPVSFGVGSGRIAGTITLTPESNKQIHAVAHVQFSRVDISKLMAATHVFKGAGMLQGKFALDSTGNSIATWAADGNGGAALYMTGGNLSALLVSLSGLEFGNALIAALGLPKQTDVRCFVGDFALQHGIFDTRTLLLDTGTAIVRGGGTVNLHNEAIDYRIQSKPKHFSIGSLPAPIDIGGTMKKPSIGPAKEPLAVRGGAMVALGIVAAPLALLPTIQFGVKDPHVCQELVSEAETEAKEGHPGHGAAPPSAAAPKPPPGEKHPAARQTAARRPPPAKHITADQLNRLELQQKSR